MATILLLTHVQADGSLPKAACEALTAAKQTAACIDGATLSIGLFGTEVQDAANALASCGASAIFGVAGPDFGSARYATDAAAAAALMTASGAEVVLAPATSRLSRALPGATQRVGGRIDSHVSGIATNDNKITIKRWYYRQRMEGTLSREHRPWVLLIDPGVFPAAPAEAGTATVQMVEAAAGADDQRTTVVGVEAPASDAQTIRPDARVLFVAGAGWTKKQTDGQPHVDQAAELILGFLGKSRASLGSSKSLVDLQTEGQKTLSFMSHLNQVGQTGSTPRHPKGLATCCHGEEPHVVGWRFINERRAVNLDPNCGWAQGKADVLYVADAFEVMTKVNALLE